MHRFPLFLVGKVAKGFGRGSKELGMPTANFSDDVVENIPEDVNAGIYFGWANVDGGPVYKAVVSIGWNPFYQNTKKSAETYILHEFPHQFYGSMLRLGVVGYLRPERDFDAVEALIRQMNEDVLEASAKLDLPEYAAFKSHAIFTDGGDVQNQ